MCRSTFFARPGDSRSRVRVWPEVQDLNAERNAASALEGEGGKSSKGMVHRHQISIRTTKRL
jgi:hypothetical protein